MQTLVSKLYGLEAARGILPELSALLDRYRGRIPAPRTRGLSEKDALLITYPDQVQEPGTRTLATLGDFCAAHLQGLISSIHILPFFPWSSDDGFSVRDYESVAPEYGTWEDVGRLGARFRLMFDAVINHASARGSWFEGFLDDRPEFRDFFIEVRGNPDLSAVVRPRALPLLTEFDSPGGERKLWTTFSPDQVDLNYHNPRVLLKVLDVLLFYASQGAEFIRLDAIAYLWKEPGTSCISLPQTHAIVQLMRAVLDDVAPHVMLITETNVPNQENLSYFGNGSNEAQLVYNFPLPPLVLHALQTGSARVLSQWASELQLPSAQDTFLNFLASHDGIGLNPARGILPEAEIENMARRITAGGGFVSNKTNTDGTQSPYELNANYFDALNDPAFPLSQDLQVDRFVAAHAILLAFAGMPALYFHSLFGSRGWAEGVQNTHKYRTINRQKLERFRLEVELSDPESLRARIFGRLVRLLQIRASRPCFSPHAAQRVLTAGDGAFVIDREDGGAGSSVLCIQSVSRSRLRARVELKGTLLASAPQLHDLLTDRQFESANLLALDLAPFQTLWITN